MRRRKVGIGVSAGLTDAVAAPAGDPDVRLYTPLSPLDNRDRYILFFDGVSGGTWSLSSTAGPTISNIPWNVTNVALRNLIYTAWENESETVSVFSAGTASTVESGTVNHDGGFTVRFAIQSYALSATVDGTNLT